VARSITARDCGVEILRHCTKSKPRTLSNPANTLRPANISSPNDMCLSLHHLNHQLFQSPNLALGFPFCLEFLACKFIFNFRDDLHSNMWPEFRSDGHLISYDSTCLVLCWPVFHGPSSSSTMSDLGTMRWRYACLMGEYLRNVLVGSTGWECQFVDHFSRICRLEFVDHADESVPVGKSTWMSLVGDPLRDSNK
jgi:hypothetical protein